MSNPDSFSYYLPTAIEFGPGILRLLPQFLAKWGFERPAILTSEGFPKRHQQLWSEFAAIGINQSLSFVDPNPTVESLEALCLELRDVAPDVLIGIGGGSVMDTARILSLAVGANAPMREVITAPGEFLPRRMGLIQVPTTSGTASEVTPWATVWDVTEGKKLSCSHLELFADVAIIDPQLAVGMPARLTAITGMDTLSHCLETLWSQQSQPLSELFAVKALPLVLRALPRAVHQPMELEPRVAMAKACLWAGLAFSQTKTAAAHSISYPMTLLHDVPHGIACSITLPELLRQNAAVAPERMAFIARTMGCDTVEAAAQTIETLIKDIQLPSRLSELGIQESDLDELSSRSVTKGRMDNNIRVYKPQEVRQILASIL